MPPPVLCIERAIVGNPLGADVFSHIRKRRLIFRAVLLRAGKAKIENEHVTRPASDVQTIHPGNNYVRVWPPMRIWLAQHFQSLFLSDVESAAFSVAHKGDIEIGL